jgi:hypothetical protein
VFPSPAVLCVKIPLEDYLYNNKSPIEMGDNLTLKTTNMKILTILPIITSLLMDLFNKVVKGFIT